MGSSWTRAQTRVPCIGRRILNHCATREVLCTSFMWAYVFISPGKKPRSRTAESYGNSLFNILRNCQTVFWSDCVVLYFHQQWMRISVSPHLRQYLLLSVFLIRAIIVGIKWHLIVALISFFLMSNDIEHLFMCLLTICISPLEKIVLHILCPFFNWVISFFIEF